MEGSTMIKTDEELIEAWMCTKGAHTRRNYTDDLKRFRRFTGGIPLHAVTLRTLQAFGDSLAAEGLRASSQGRTIGAVKSLLSFGVEVGYLARNAGQSWKIPKGEPAARGSIQEADLYRMLSVVDGRNSVLLRLLTVPDLTVENVCALRWGALREGGDSGCLVLGNSSVALSPEIWRSLLAIKPAWATLDTPVFLSRKKGGCLSVSQAWRIVTSAAKEAGVVGKIGPNSLKVVKPTLKNLALEFQSGTVVTRSLVTADIASLWAQVETGNVEIIISAVAAGQIQILVMQSR